jgi:hypothetical protein
MHLSNIFPDRERQRPDFVMATEAAQNRNNNNNSPQVNFPNNHPWSHNNNNGLEIKIFKYFLFKK